MKTMKCVGAAAMAWAIGTAVAAPVDGARPSAELAQGGGAVPLSQHAVEVASLEWLKSGVARELVGTNGEVMYAYGQSRPTITCAPLHICVVDLIKGEHITNVSIGDSVRWLVQPAAAGETPVLVLKPTAAGLVTNLVVTTDAARVYYMTLQSDSRDYVPLIGFYDPQSLVINMQQQVVQERTVAQARADEQRRAVVAPLGSVDPSKLDFGFSCDAGESSVAFKPVRVFAGGGHTYIQMPSAMKDGDAPAVFGVVGGQTSLLNSRLVDGYFVLDGLPAEFKLVVGSGKDARGVTCRHGTPGGSSPWAWMGR